VENKLNKIIKDLGLSDAKLSPLYKDASLRRYYRVSYPKGTLVIMSQDDPISDNDTNLSAIEDFRGLGVNVPAVKKVYREQGVVIQEDLGDEHLESVKDRSVLSSYYSDAVNLLLKFQIAAAAVQKEGKTKLSVLNTSFTNEKFISELRMTTDYYIKRHQGVNLDEHMASMLESFYSDLVYNMMSQPFLLQHRDYHSRNIMVKDGHLFFIDVQDSRLGPLAYDIASLMIDPYIDLDDDIVNNCIEMYYKGINKIVPCTRGEFDGFYGTCFLQRGIKILGTFSYQNVERGNSKYLTYIPTTLKKIKQISSNFPKWSGVINEVFHI